MKTSAQIITKNNYPIGAKVDFSPFIESIYRHAVGEIVKVNAETISVKVFGEVREFGPLDIWVIRL